MTARSRRAKPKILWRELPEEHNYPAALSFLTLVFDDRKAAKYIRRLRAAPIEKFKAKDVFRASGLSLLGVSNSHVERDRRKISAREKLSPILLVRAPPTVRVIIADGYHRLCAVYSIDEDALVPCKIA
jgi:hypothetical protein